MRRSEPRRNEPVQRATTRFRCRATEHPLGCGIEQHHLLAFVDANDSVHRRVDDALKPRLVFPQALFGLFSVADVTGYLFTRALLRQLVRLDIAPRANPFPNPTV